MSKSERNSVKKPNDVADEQYLGLPEGNFHLESLPPQATATLSITDSGVWSTAVMLYTNTVDLQTGKTYTGQPLPEVADGTVRLAASSCQTIAIDYSTGCDRRIAELDATAATHLAAAVDEIEHCAGILEEPVTGPDGQMVDGRRLHAIQRRDEELARQRSEEGDSRHTEQSWASGWRMIAATLLGLLDVLLLWKPLLNLSFESSSGSVFRWAIGGGLAALQVLCIEWSVRVYVNAERMSVDRRGAAGDYNRPLKTGRITVDRPPPDPAELVDADTHMAHAYRGLVLVAAFIAIIGGVRVAVLAKRASLAIYEAALFGTIIGLLLGGLVIWMARLYCRSNLLGDRLRAERDALTELNDKIQHSRGVVAEEREHALAALATADTLAAAAIRIRNQTVADYWRAVQLAWTWLGLPHSSLDYAAFEAQAMPVPPDTGTHREELRRKLEIVNQWLAERPSLFTPSPALALLPAGTGAGPQAEAIRLTPLLPPKDGRLVIAGPRPVDVPVRPAPPHRWMLAGAVLTVVATILTAFLAVGPEADDQAIAMHSTTRPQSR
jgi:hypothetical protein